MKLKIGRAGGSPLVSCRKWGGRARITIRTYLHWPSAPTKGFLVFGWPWAGEVETIATYFKTLSSAYFPWEKATCLMGTPVTSPTRGQGGLQRDDHISSPQSSRNHYRIMAAFYMYSPATVIWRGKKLYAAFQIGCKKYKIIPRARWVWGNKPSYILSVGISIGEVSLESSLAVYEIYKPFVLSIRL